MEYKVLYRKYRPNDFDSLVGQEYTKKLLMNSIVQDHISHAYIFTGPRGTGKTSSAKIFAKAINCLHPVNGNPCNECEQCLNFRQNPDIIEIDAASNNGVDEVREIINNVKLAPAQSKYKVYIIDEFHMLSTSAFNALLLTLEEPPSHVVFILATTDIQSVPITVLSRCQRFDFRPISTEDIVKRLQYVCHEEKIDITDDAIKEIAFMSNGGLRDALSILDQVSSTGNKIDVDDITKNFGSVSLKKMNLFFEYLIHNDVSNMIELLHGFNQDGVNARILIEKIVDLLKNKLLDYKLGNEMESYDYDSLYDFAISLNDILGQMKTSIDPYIFIEMLVLKHMNGHVGVAPSEQTQLETKKVETKAVEKTVIIETKEKVIKQEEKVEEPKQEVKETKEEVRKELTSGQLSTANFDVHARVNNTFVGASKTYKTELNQKWNDFVIYESNANKALMSFIMDTALELASDQYAVLTNSLESTCDLINQNIDSLEKDFKIFFGKSYKLVAISEKEWDKEKNLFSERRGTGYKYQMIDESIVLHENTSELEKLADEIFGKQYETK